MPRRLQDFNKLELIFIDWVIPSRRLDIKPEQFLNSSGVSSEITAVDECERHAKGLSGGAESHRSVGV